MVQRDDRNCGLMSGILESPSETTQHVGSDSPRFRGDIEGLRAIAVVIVVAFHAAVPGFGGGFVGVDIFFVISGYVITGVLLREMLGTGRLSFRHFYARRARRILPAASLVLTATMVGSWLILPPLAILHAAQDILSAALYAANWRFIALGTDYLAQSTSDSPVLHYWSLAVEEQFYIVWPLLLIGAVWLSRRFPMSGTRVILVVLGTATAVSFAYSLIETSSSASFAYMATTTRAWEFGCGGLLAVISHALGSESELGAIRRRIAAPLGWLGLAAIAVSVVVISSATPFPGVAALLPVIGTVAVIASGSISTSTRGSVNALLALPPLRFIGRISFSWYLWHWPILILTQAAFGELSWQVNGLLMLGALGLSIASYYLVERTLMNSRTFRKRATSAIALGLVATVVSTSIALTAGTAEATTLNTTARLASASASFKSVFETKSTRNSGEVTPSPLAASKDIPQPPYCLLDTQITYKVPCVVGDLTGTNVVLFGDSHAEQWLPALIPIAYERGWRLTVLTKAGCPAAKLLPSGKGERFASADCLKFRWDAIKEIVKQIKPKIILVSGLSSYISSKSAMLTAWNSTLDQLSPIGAKIVYIRDTPKPLSDVPTCISGALEDWSKCSFAFNGTLRNEPLMDRSVDKATRNLVTVDLTKYFCQKNVCPAVLNGTLIYRDDSHITATAARALAPALDQLLVDAKVVSWTKSP
jgi:peptidoglycan/LPS O-acetylase OafA/YrhL